MKRKKNEILTFYSCKIILIILLFNFLVYGQNVEFDKEIDISFLNIKECKSFCMTDDGLFIFSDYEDENIKFFTESGGHWVMGRRGYLIGEFIKPKLCFYNNKENKLFIYVKGMNEFYVYDRLRYCEFKYIKRTRFLLYEIYHDDELVFDVYNNYIYYVLKKELKVIKSNKFTGRNINCFSKKPPHYNDFVIYGIFVTDRSVIVIYGEFNCFVQFYTHDGDFFCEKSINNKFSEIVFLDKLNMNLYFLIDNKSLVKYKISD